MSAFSGPQGKGARARLRAQKHAEAVARGCHKMGYPTEYAARVELVGTVVSRNKGKNQRHECRVYECPTCGNWHLTSQPYRPHVTRGIAS